MAEPPAAITVVEYLIDEIRQTAGLLRVADTVRTVERPWWRTFVLSLVRTPTEVSSDLNLLYVGQNIDRARDHWRDALAHRAELPTVARPSEVVARLDADLGAAGIDTVLPRLQHEAIPAPVKAMTAHLAEVVDTIRECDRLASAVRNELMLEQMRSRPTDEPLR